MYHFGGGSSNYQSFRARLATARGPLSMKFSFENINVLIGNIPEHLDKIIIWIVI